MAAASDVLRPHFMFSSVVNTHICDFKHLKILTCVCEL